MADGTWSLEWTWGDAQGWTDVQAPQWSERAALFGRAGDQTRSVDLEVRPILPRTIGSHAALFPPWSATATLSRDGVPVISGQWSAVQYDDSTVTLTLTDSALDDAALVPSDGTIYVRDQDRYNELLEVKATWGVAAKFLTYRLLTAASRRAVGLLGPMVFGSPGTALNPGSQAWIVDQTSPDKKLLIARHTVAAQNVTVWGPGYDEVAAGDADVYISLTFPVLSGLDADGQTYSYIELPVPTPGAGDIAPSNSHDFFVSWTDGEGLSGGAGDVCLTLLAQSTLRVDVAAWVRVRDSLNRYRLAGYVTEAVAPSALLYESILPVLPVQVVYTADGVAPLLWPWLDQQDAPTEVELVAGRGIALAGRVSYLADVPTTSLELGYGPDPQNGQRMTAAASITPETSPYMRAAASLVGPRGRQESLECGWLWDDATASELAALRARLGARPMRAVPYMADPTRYGPGGAEYLQVGVPVSLTDERLGLDAAPAVVGEIETDADTMRLTLYLRDDILRD
jgi:hypothetical protein